MNKTFDDTVLLRISREYSKDEAVAFLLKEVKDLKFKIGELLSENTELKSDLKTKTNPKVVKIIEKSKGWTKELENDYIRDLKKEIENLGTQLRKTKEYEKEKKLRKEVEMWRNKFFDLQASINKKSI